MQIHICQKNPKKNRCKDAAAQESENFAEQNSRQESENPWMDFRFHVFGNAERKKSEFYKKFRPAVEPRSSGANECERKNER